MGSVSFGIPKKLVGLIRDHYSIKTFVETGTFRGKTAAWAAGIFENVYTVEFSKDLFESTSKELSAYRNIHMLFGNSAEQLKNITEQLKEPAIFWLDAHWCGGSTYGSSDPCPLLKEIEVVMGSPFGHVIMIDDARFFLIPPPEPQDPVQWPGLKEITNLLNRNSNSFTFVTEDVIVSMPESGKKFLMPYFNDIHKNEFPGGGIIKNLGYALRNVSRKWRS